jgi:hypothetical protein
MAGAQLVGADLRVADLHGADLHGANLREADLRYTRLLETNLENADLTGCFIYGISAWNVKLDGSVQADLFIGDASDPPITVDNLEIAQFIYLLLNNERIRHVIQTITSRLVLILGNFSPKRKVVLDALRNELRALGYVPVLFDFDKPSGRNLTETVSTLAHMSRFIVADITSPRSVPHELASIVPRLRVPVQPLIQRSQRPYGMFLDFDPRDYHWVLPIHRYATMKSLIRGLRTAVIAPAEAKAAELEAR